MGFGPPEYDFAVGFGRCFGQNWIDVLCMEPGTTSRNIYDLMPRRAPEHAQSVKEPDPISRNIYYLMLARAPEHAQSIKKARPGAARCQVYISHTRLPRSTWILQTSCVMWKSSGICGLKLEVFRNPGFDIPSGEWRLRC